MSIMHGCQYLLSKITLKYFAELFYFFIILLNFATVGYLVFVSFSYFSADIGQPMGGGVCVMRVQSGSSPPHEIIFLLRNS